VKSVVEAFLETGRHIMRRCAVHQIAESILRHQAFLALLVIVGVWSQASLWAAEQDAAPAVAAARGLLQRLLPAHADRFELQAIPSDPGGDVFEIESCNGKIVLRGNTGVSLASALNWYLKHHCHCHVSWCGSQLQLPDPLPVVREKIRHVSPFRYRYCFNYCAFSYTLAWWDWAQWERMIDWMALHGINLPLSVTGQEAVWLEVYRQLGLSDVEIKEFFVGPGFLPFGWMGCLDGWCGPLPDSWIAQHAVLQKKIVARERALGMIPVLQGFTGHVPAALAKRFPNARFQQLPKWCEFPPTSFVDPQDPLFVRIGKLFIEEQTKQFGTDHYYASDTFIEMQPPSSEPAFLAAMGKTVYEAMRVADPQAVWVLQGWIFVNNPKFWQPPQGRALLGSVPDDRLLVLDLHCEATPAWSLTEAFYGKPWVWCIIQNFGGTVSLHGALPRMAADLTSAMTTPKRGRQCGIGLIFEGLDYNPVVQDFVTDMTWRREVPALDEWVPQFVRRRYGRTTPEIDQAWQLLRQSVYQQVGRADTALVARPSRAAHSWGSGNVGYDPALLGQAVDKLLVRSDQLAAVDTFQFDVVNATRQALGILAGYFAEQVQVAVQRADCAALEQAGRDLLGLADDLDALLATRPEFLLGRWLEDAKRWAANDDERRLYEWNARNIITLWGPRDSVLHEYASRQWSGMFSNFYRPRWEKYLEARRAALDSKQPFDNGRLEQELRTWEDQWTHRTEAHPTAPHGDPVATARRLWAKYQPAFRKSLEPEVVSLTTGKPATCSHALAAHPARLANDGRRRNTNQFWATDVNVSKEAWWHVDFEKPVTVGRVVVVGYFGDQRYYGFTVEVSRDGQQWEVIADRRDNKDPATADGYTCTFPPRPARFLRVTQTHNSANSGRHLVEVMAYER
jgi:alpha-N-acetylglucosaminidase